MIIMYNDSSSLVTIDELCEILMIGKNTAYSLLKSEQSKALKLIVYGRYHVLVLMNILQSK